MRDLVIEVEALSSNDIFGDGTTGKTERRTEVRIMHASFIVIVDQTIPTAVYWTSNVYTPFSTD